MGRIASDCFRTSGDRSSRHEMTGATIDVRSRPAGSKVPNCSMSHSSNDERRRGLGFSRLVAKPAIMGSSPSQALPMAVRVLAAAFRVGAFWSERMVQTGTTKGLVNFSKGLPIPVAMAEMLERERSLTMMFVSASRPLRAPAISPETARGRTSATRRVLRGQIS
jgi:hypothetical protein